MQKRILSILLCVFLVLSFAACGTTPENPSDTSVNSSATAGNSASDSGSTSDSVSVTDSVSSGTVTDTDSVTDVFTSGTTDSDWEMTDESGGTVDLAPGGDSDSGMGDNTDSYDPSTDPGIWGEDTSTNPDTPLWPDNTQDSSNPPSSDDGSESESVDITAGRKFLATDIANYGIVVYDLDACNGDYQKLTDDNVSIFWEWTYSGDPNGRLRGPGVGIDSAKLRYSDYYKRDVVIACSSSGWAGIIDYEARSLLWESDASILHNAHSIEMLSTGDLVVAVAQARSSKVNCLLYFNISSGSTTPTHGIAGEYSHGVSWDPTNNCLWVLDATEVYAVKVENPGPNGKLKVVDGSSVGGFSNGHAFSPVAGSPGKYWIGAGSTVYQFDTKTKTLTKCADVLQQYGIKGIASFIDGTVVLAAHKIGGGSPTYGWSSDGFRIVTSDGKSVTVPFDTKHREFYKVQPFTRSYQ